MLRALPKIHRARGWLAVLALIGLATLALPRPAAADEFDDFTRAKNAYEAGEYEAAVERFEALIEGEPKNPALELEAHKLLGVSYLFVGRPEEAERSFLKLLTLSPGYELDPMLFPIEVIDFFTEVKARNDERLAALARARAAEEEARRRAEEEARLAELEKLKRNVYLERSREERSLLVAVMPLGAGQFQNGDTVAGALFLGGELLLGAAAVTTFILHEGLRSRAEEPFDSPDDRRAYERLEKGYRVANHVSLGALATVTVAGILEAVYRFERESVTWQPIPEGDVPEHLRPGSSDGGPSSTLRLAPFFSEGGGGLGAAGTF